MYVCMYMCIYIYIYIYTYYMFSAPGRRRARAVPQERKDSVGPPRRAPRPLRELKIMGSYSRQEMKGPR